ncbi:aminoacyl--tRNA ligase-related protein [Paraburkholderia sp. BL17N1]|uniref:aminoacyl--tRNA ligase-related protein n=1 Tax=Paraburkholderia sp. BL17N1 TaxID=1938798 RepID=UPI000EADDE57|nr:aminoacyl--tRNA ligase-related protein [Paraburkholderia sp. BL17N1]RKR36216.1 prolyl-tRNA synthetase [Paraburkholderia sp. BL17N1]
MKFSQQFFSNSFFEQDNTRLDLTDLARKACFIHQDAAGLYSWMSLGLRAQRRVEVVVREEMDRAGFCEVQMSLLQDADLWRQSGRIDAYGDELMRVTNRSGRLFCLGATCEELTTNMVKTHYNKTDLSLGLYQFGNKYRDELRTRSGLARAKEFIMKDAYAFNATEAGAREAYEAVRDAYIRIFNRLGLDAIIRSCDNGEIGGRSSEEFHVLSELGEDETDGQKSLECAHIFDLGDRYSRAMGLVNAQGEFVKMGCFGVGISRLVMLLLSRQRDDRGFWGSECFNAFDVVLTVIDWERQEHQDEAEKLRRVLQTKGLSVLVDDRLAQAGKKLADAELIACRQRVVVGKNAILSGRFEWMDRRTLARESATVEQIAELCTRKL